MLASIFNFIERLGRRGYIEGSVSFVREGNKIFGYHGATDPERSDLPPIPNKQLQSATSDELLEAYCEKSGVPAQNREWLKREIALSTAQAKSGKRDLDWCGQIEAERAVDGARPTHIEQEAAEAGAALPPLPTEAPVKWADRNKQFFGKDDIVAFIKATYEPWLGPNGKFGRGDFDKLDPGGYAKLRRMEKKASEGEGQDIDFSSEIGFSPDNRGRPNRAYKVTRR